MIRNKTNILGSILVTYFLPESTVFESSGSSTNIKIGVRVDIAAKHDLNEIDCRKSMKVIRFGNAFACSHVQITIFRKDYRFYMIVFYR